MNHKYIVAISNFAFFPSLRETFFVRTVLTISSYAAAEFIRNGGIVAFPTETVYGLGANVFDLAAIEKIFEAKQRPSDNPLIAHIGELEQIGSLSSDITETASKLIDAFFPGPLTIVLKKNERVPLIATAGLDTVGIRMPRLELAREFLKLCGTPVVAPSANLSGRPSPTTWQAAREDLDGRIDCILQGEAAEIGLESTVVDCTGKFPRILRIGAITFDQLCSVVSEIEQFVEESSETPRSPGLKHRHYSPRANVIVVTSPMTALFKSNSAFIGLNKPEFEFKIMKITDSVEEYAHEVFEFFRECDRHMLETVYCGAVSEQGIGAALMDRIRRAAE